ncbi:MAG: hypothetical protein ABEJ76_00475 [Halanaeroarchaeum sp.]
MAEEEPSRGGSDGPILAYATDPEPSSVPIDAESDRSRWWVIGIYLGTGLLVYGAIWGGTVAFFGGYLMVPVAMYLDAAYVESVTPGWKRDDGLILLGSILALFLMVPYYLYVRHKLLR